MTDTDAVCMLVQTKYRTVQYGTHSVLDLYLVVVVFLRAMGLFLHGSCFNSTVLYCTVYDGNDRTATMTLYK